MDWILIIKAILALAFVLGLLMLTLYIIKYCQIKGIKNPFMTKMKAEDIVNIKILKKIDAKNSLTVVEFDKKQYLILLGNNQNIVIDTKNKVK